MEENKLDSMREIIQRSNMAEKDKTQIYQNLLQIKNQTINLLITGATGCGKSSKHRVHFLG